MEKLGIQPIPLLTQAINFILMVILLTKFLYKPILRALNERKKKIAEGLAYTQKMKLEEEKLEGKRQEILDKAKVEARKIINEGKEAGKRLEKDIIEKAHQEAAEIIEKSKKDIDLERAELEKRLRDKTIDVAEAMIKSLLADALSEKDQKAILKKKLSSIERITR